MAEIRKASGSSGARGVVSIAQARAQRVAPVDRIDRVDSAGVSSRARELATAHEAVTAAPDVREGRIEEFQSLIERGAYHPDPREIAQRILERGI
jgi:flagellar biosynthesis anti-sigma factor FlgM